MENERLIEIINKIISFFKTSSHLFGICEVIYWLYNQLDFISHDEYNFIIAYLLKNKPTPENEYKEFTKHKLWNTSTLYFSYWWYKSDIAEKKAESRKIRIEYLEALISNIKKE